MKHFSVAEKEAAAFGDLDKPDLYYQYYTELHGSRSVFSGVFGVCDRVD